LFIVIVALNIAATVPIVNPLLFQWFKLALDRAKKCAGVRLLPAFPLPVTSDPVQ
jgi:hypothetical protein